MKIHIVSYNMAMGKNGEDRNKIIKSKEAALEVFENGFSNLYKQDPEGVWLICVEEINKNDGGNQVEQVKDSLEQTTSVKWYTHRNKNGVSLDGESIAVFSNYQNIGEKEKISLPGGKWGSYRVAMLLEFEIAAGKKLGLVSTHFIQPSEDQDPEGEKRKDSMSLILERIREHFNDANEPVIICGDLNVFDTSSSDIYNIPKDDDAIAVYNNTIGQALEAGFKKGYQPTRDDITYHAWDDPSNLPSDKSWGIFDYILVRNGSSTFGDHEIINFKNADSIPASDHKGVHLQLDYSEGGSSTTIEWGEEIQFPDESSGFDNDSILAIAMNNENHLVEVHCDEHGNHYYMVGYLRFNKYNLNDSDDTGTAYIEWNTADTASQVYETGQGKRIAVAIDDCDNIVEVHTDSDEDDHRYRVGKLALEYNDESKPSWKIDWQPADSHNYDTGKDLAVAMDNKMNIVEVHRGQSKKHDQELSANIGKVVSSGDSQTSIEWHDEGNSYTDGYNPAVTMNDNLFVVEAHRGNDHKEQHYYRLGVLDPSKKDISWKVTSKFDDSNDEDVTGVAVAMDNNSNVAYVYTTETTKDIWYAIGNIDTANNNILWNTGNTIGINAQCSKIALTMDNNHNVIVVYFKSGESIPYYRVGKLIKAENQ